VPDSHRSDSGNTRTFAAGPLPTARLGGVCLHITSLPGPCGIGDIGHAAYDFVDFLRASGLDVWQFLPLGPTGYGNSPYQPLSSFAGNELLVAVDDLVDLGLLKAREAAPLAELPAAYVDFDALIPRKKALLDLAADRFTVRAHTRLAAEFDDFVALHDDAWLRDYALFRVLKSVSGDRSWQAWPEEFRARVPAALQGFENAQRERLAAVRIQQFLFHRQWQVLRQYANESGVLLFGDLPIYIALDSADAWSHPELLRLASNGWPTAVAGVPPDYFSEDGQLWGNPLYDWLVHAETGYRWWIERMRASVRLADLVRIDHFRGFESYWSIPAGATTARDGCWEPGPRDAIFEAFRSALGGLPIVAENLGVITDEVEALRHRHKLPGMVVLQFAVCDPGFRLDAVGSNEVCYSGTHDNDTTLGWFDGSGQDARSAADVRAAQQAALRVTGGEPRNIALDFVRAAFRTPARLAIAPLQDFLQLGSEARMNAPGKPADNWRWRTTAAQLSGDLCDNIAAIVADSGREGTYGRRDPE
jgi:4-alpha-glucanotransferase